VTRHIIRTLTAPLAAMLLVQAATAHAAAAELAKKAFEIVESAGLNIPDPLVAQDIESFVDEHVTTTKAGQLIVTKSVNLSASCSIATSGVLYFLMVDDLPIRNSTVFSRDGVVGQLTGVTADTIEAGTHRIQIGEVCTQPGATVNGGSVTLVGITSVIVLP
jgi:hypothetical protein